MAEKCTNTSGPPSTAMNPYPFSPLNHFTVPCAMTASWPRFGTPAGNAAARSRSGTRPRRRAELARRRAVHGWEAGQAGLEQAQERQYTMLLQQLGAGYYAEQWGEGSREAVLRAVAALD